MNKIKKDQLSGYRLDHELKHLQELVNISLALADEVGNPLTAVEGAIDWLHQCWQNHMRHEETDSKDAQQVRECFSILRRQTERIATTLRNFRSFSLLSSRQTELTDLNEMLQIVIALLKLEKRGEDGNFQVELAPEVPALILERSSIVTSMLFILRAAAGVVQPVGGTVRISTSFKNDQVTIDVSAHADGPGNGCLGQCELLGCSKNSAGERSDMDIGFVRYMIEKQGGTFTLHCLQGKTCEVSLGFSVCANHDSIAV